MSSARVRRHDYWSDLADRAAGDTALNLGRLMDAHSSTAFHNLVLLRTGLGHSQGSRDHTHRDRDRTDHADDPPGSHPSVHTCEHLPTSGENPHTAPDFGSSDATEALRAGLSWSRDRQRRIIELIEHDEIGHAKRFAKCRRQSVQLECGACGSDYNYVPISCDSRLCPDCMNRRMGRAIGRFEPLVSDMDSPTFGTLTIENSSEIESGVDAIRDAFSKLRRRTIPPSGSVTREIDGEIVTKRWVWSMSDDGGEPADHYWKSALCAAGKHDLARSIQKRYVDQNKQIPFTELVKGGVYGIDIKQQEEERYHVHLHTLIDSAYLPQAAISSVWEDITGAPVVDLRRADLGALNDVVGYVTKPPEFESIEAEIEYLTTLKGTRLLQPFGSLHGQTTASAALLRCADCDIAPTEWDYLGLVDHAYDNTSTNWDTDGDRPPPD